jgi:membrane associated rhomboid family serine protease
LHAGFLHIALNMLAQLTASAQVSIVVHAFRIIDHPCVYAFQIEREMGSGGFFILYFAAGIFG